MLSPGSLVELEADVEGTSIALSGAIQTVTDDTVSFAFRREGKGLPFARGAAIHVNVIERAEVVSFDSTVLAMNRMERTIVVLADLPDSYTVDRRNYFRLPWRVGVRLRWIREDNVKTMRLETEDISGGGIGVIVPEPVEIDQRASMSLRIEPGKSIACDVRVARVSQIAFSDPPVYRVGLIFDEITEIERERLIAMLFERQREERAEGRRG